jgi:transcriptional regulator
MQGLKAKRKERKMTAIELAKVLSVQQSSISMWERGKAFPRKEMLDKLCEFFDCKVDDLL